MIMKWLSELHTLLKKTTVEQIPEHRVAHTKDSGKEKAWGV